MAGPIDAFRAALADRYRLDREIGRGGMATVYLAEDLRHGRQVAIKVLDPQLAAVIGPDRFLREIHTAARLAHPHILPLHDSGAATGLLYYVMPHVEGESLRARLNRERQLPIADALELAADVARALSYAHAKGVVHRDIKPENVLIESGHAVVADFGIARAIEEMGSERLTETGVTVGTPAYMSPEQTTGIHVDGRSDLYSLGCVLYEMVAGQPPFTGATAASVIHQHVGASPRLVSDLRPGVPEAVERVIVRALSKTPADRFQTGAAMAEALEAGLASSSDIGRMPEGGHASQAIGNTTDASRPTMAMPRARPNRVPIRNSRRRTATLVLVGILALAIVGTLSWNRIVRALHRTGDVGRRREWVLVSAIASPPEDRELGAAVKDMITAALDQSTILAPVPEGQVLEALRHSGRPDTTRVDGELARELAYRRSVRAVVEGNIGRVGTGYSVVFRATNTEDGSPLLTVDGVAADERALLATVERLSQRLRAGLGERRSAIQSSRPFTDVITPSYEAYRRIVQGNERHQGGDDIGAVSLYRAALELDPDCAAAWLGLAGAFTNLGYVDSAETALKEARRRPERLTERQRVGLETRIAASGGDWRAALEAYNRLVQSYPESQLALNNRANILSDMGRLTEALADYDRCIQLSALWPSQILIWNREQTLVVMGRFDEARRATHAMSGENARVASIEIELCASDWAQAESLGTILADNATSSGWERTHETRALAAALGARGDLDGAARTLRRAQAVRAADDPIARQAALRDRLLLAVISGAPAGTLDGPGAEDSTRTALVTRGLWAAAEGDSQGANTMLRRIQVGLSETQEPEGVAPEMLRAWIAGKSGRWQECVEILAAPARGRWDHPSSLPTSSVMMQQLVAEAFERLGRPDSAAVYYEMILGPPADAEASAFSRGLVFSLTHLRLAQLYSKVGRWDAARRHFLLVTETATKADSKMNKLINEARVRMAASNGTTGSR